MRGKKLVTVFSLTGKALVAGSSDSGSISIDVGHLSAGTYFVKVIIEGCAKTIRFQKLESR
ncbi:MAG: T9SS type A sorting domain-containing protein [Cytophagales bacterium]